MLPFLLNETQSERMLAGKNKESQGFLVVFVIYLFISFLRWGQGGLELDV